MAAQLLAFWNEQLLPQAGGVLARIALALVALVVVVLSGRLALSATNRALARTRAHANARLLVDRVVEFGFLLLAAVWVLSIFGIQLTAVVTVLGLAGLAVSLALQDLLKNLVAGLYILIERPFTIGEQIDFKTFSGIVETIELRTTALRTGGGQRVIIPNAMLFADALVNRSVYGRQLVRLRVVVPLAAGERAADQDVMEDAVAALREIAGAAVSGDAPAPAVVVESLSGEKAVLRAELWAADARATAAGAAWALRRHLLGAEVSVLE